MAANEKFANASERSSADYHTFAEATRRMVNATDRTALSAGVVCEPALSITSPPIGKNLQITLSVFNSYSRPVSHATVRAAAVMAGQSGPQFGRYKQRIL